MPDTTTTRSVIVETGDAPSAGKDLARAHPKPADRGVADAERLPAGHKFSFRSEPMPPRWNGVTDCEVLVVEPCERLAYSWNSSGAEAANGIRTVVTWTLTPTTGGTNVRMEQSGFRPQDESFYRGAGYGWQRFIAGLERIVAGLC